MASSQQPEPVESRGVTLSNHYGSIAYTDAVKDLQQRYGSRRFYARHEARTTGDERSDALTPDVEEYIADRDSFYLASVGETGWPYVQFRGGPPGFLQVLDEHTLGWADFRGNLQYITTGNLTGNERVALFVMDYPNRQRLKIFGHARVAYPDEEPELVARLTRPDYEAVVERAVVVSVDAFDWNCRQHIAPRYTVAELEPHLSGLNDRIAALEAENAELRGLLAAEE
jgi:uncharacterized protein